MQYSVRQLTLDDIPAALAFCRSADWNQLLEDWERLIEYQPDGCFAAKIGGALVGTVTTTCYGTELAWIGMMLVHPDHRRRGMATALMQSSLDYLRRRKIACIKLDATPLGQTVYRQLGFSVERTFQRWQCRCEQHGSTGNCRPLDEPHFALDQSHLALDRRAFKVDRKDWLQRLAAGSHVRVTDGGFGMLRRGAVADYLGPVVAESPSIAREIIRQLLHSVQTDQVFWDVMNADAVQLATSLGFQPDRDLTRMWIGDKLIEPDMDLQYAISDPGTG